MRARLQGHLAALLVALSSFMVAAYPRRYVYISVIIIYIIVLNLVFIGGLASGVAGLGSVFVGSIIVLLSILKIINFYNIYIMDISVAVIVIMLATTHWHEELVRVQYTALYPVSMITALILAYSIGTENPLQLILLSALEGHLLYQALSPKPTIGGLLLAGLYLITVYSLFTAAIGQIPGIPIVMATSILKIISGYRSRFAQVYASLDFYLKVIAGGLRI